MPIIFNLGRSRIEAGSLPNLEAIASVLRTDPSLHLVIEAHANDRGSYNHNTFLSWDRALGVVRTLGGKLRHRSASPAADGRGTLAQAGSIFTS